MEQPTTMICGGPCCHCTRTASPCWRRGPPEKPILCNACGTRYSVKRSLDGYFPGRRAQNRPNWVTRPSVEDSAMMVKFEPSEKAEGGEVGTKMFSRERKRSGAIRDRRVLSKIKKRRNKGPSRYRRRAKVDGAWDQRMKGMSSSLNKRDTVLIPVADESLRKKSRKQARPLASHVF
ncbi:hypothetical protein BSKO_00927 [Bryopsis sp. KO-2023]|nr:hypothetical protein BSKO_00927 [Bryopsis sp. KO-2023]